MSWEKFALFFYQPFCNAINPYLYLLLLLIFFPIMTMWHFSSSFTQLIIPFLVPIINNAFPFPFFSFSSTAPFIFGMFLLLADIKMRYRNNFWYPFGIFVIRAKHAHAICSFIYTQNFCGFFFEKKILSSYLTRTFSQYREEMYT